MKEIPTQIFAKKNPLSIGETLTDDVQFRGIIDIEERVIDDDDSDCLFSAPPRALLYQTDI